MYVTKLIKQKKYRQFILSRFPKPEGTKITGSSIISSSLIGNAFEIYFKLVLYVNTKPEGFFEEELCTAQKNLDEFEIKDGLFSDQKGIRNLFVNEENLKNIKKLVTSSFTKGYYKFINNKGISRIEVFEKNSLKIFAFRKESNLEAINLFHSNSFTIYCKDDIVKMLKKEIETFKKEVNNSTQNFILTTELLSTIINFANISHSFFNINPVIHFFSKPDLKKLRQLIIEINNPFAQRNFMKIIYKPSLNWQAVRARPDFLIDNSILELKTSKEYLSSHDYLQGITYLLFSKQSPSIKKYGKINKLQIYYPFIERIFEIDASSIRLNREDQKKFKELIEKFYNRGCC